MDNKCDYCYEERSDLSSCNSCSNKLCNDCWSSESYIAEWISVELICERCTANTCPSCIVFCYDCANSTDGDEYAVTCSKCQPQLKSVCDIHTWYTCNGHVKDSEFKCGQCFANYNYSGRHQ